MKRILIAMMVLVFTATVLAYSGSESALKPFVVKPGSGRPIPVGPMGGDPVVVDCNHDGKLDIIVACGTCCGSAPSPLSGHVQILLGDGVGGFKAAVGSPIKVGPSARKVAVGDANKDGNIDIFVAQHESYEVVALLGNGAGGFKPALGSPFIAASGPNVHPRAHTHSITTGDVNRDSNLDILTTNANDNSISVLLGDGKGGFSTANAPIKAGRHPYDAIALSDLNGDGNLDLVTPNLQGDAIAPLIGDGKGGFSKLTPIAVGARPGYLALGDLNGDGRPDVVATHDDYPIVDILLGDGAGSFVPVAHSPIQPSNAVWGVAIGDMNGDKLNDLVFGSQQDEGVTIMLGDGKGGFVSMPNSPIPAGKVANYVTLADMNRDGKLDVIVSSYGSGEIRVFLNDTK